jgi:hypothetical protein
MTRTKKIRAAAKFMVAKYGTAAAPIARRRARQYSRRRDGAAVAAWRAIAKAAIVLISPRKDRKPTTLSAVLGGAVTELMMTADGVNRDDVERLMERTKARRNMKE